MIQDLNGLVFDNQYKHIQPEAEDYIISVSKGMIMLGGGYQEEERAVTGSGDRQSCESSWDEPIKFPTYEEVQAALEGKTSTPWAHGAFAERQFIYLFSIGEEKYFLAFDLEMEGYRYEKMIYLRKGNPKHNLYAGLVAMEISRFYENLKFCGKCGHPMVHADHERMMKCPECGNAEYPKICPCVIVGVIHNGKILVSQYRNGARNHYALIAGFAEVGETIEACVHREVMEETSVHVKNLHFYKSQPWPFSDSLLFGFYSELEGDPHIEIDESELAMAKWVSPEEIFEENLDYALTNEMICKFKDDYTKYGKLML